MPNVSDDQLIRAAVTGDLSVLKEWKEQNEGRDVNTVKDSCGDTPLHGACYGGSLECVKYLIESANADVNCKNNIGDTPLHGACIYGRLECVKYLIETCNADVNCKNNDGDTPLHYACDEGSLECVKYLIESANADVNCKDNDGYTPLHGACILGSLECVKYLIETCNADVNCKANDGYTPLHGACVGDSLECVKYLIESTNADVNCKANDGYTPLHGACYNGHLECVKYLIETCNANVNCKDNDGYTSLHRACIYGRLECVKYLIETCNADVNCKNNDGYTPLHGACYNGHLECVKYLIESANADVNCKANDDYTPLHKACVGDSLECVKYLIESTNADVNCKDNDGYTPLHYACYGGSLECVKYLIETCDTDVNCKNNDGYTPLHGACVGGSLECVKYLIETCNADVNCKDNDGYTPLHYACCHGQSECVEYLVNISIQNYNGTPFKLIEAKYQVKMMRSIMKRLGHLSRRNLQPQTQLQTEMQVRKQRHTNTITTPTKHDNPKIHTTTNISIGQDRRSAVRSEAKADITFLCGQGDEQQPIKANSGVLMVTVPSIQTLIDSGIQHQHVDDGTDDGTDSATALTRRLIPLPNHQPKHVQRVLECIYTGEISFDHSAPDNDTDTRDGAHDDDDGADQPTPTLHGQDDLQQLILVANEFGFWRLKLVLEAELARTHLTDDTMVDMVIFADQHNCVVLKDASMRMAARNIQTFFTHPDCSKLILHPQLMGGIHAICNGGAASNEVDDEYSAMSMMDLYKVVDESEGTAQVDSYMDRTTLMNLVRSVAPSRVAEADGAAAGEEE